jgi:N-methylhydantoinase B
MQYPVLYVYRQQTMDSGGAGEWRGGVGNRFAMAPYECDTMGVLTGGAAQSMTTHAAPGLFGGYPAPTAGVTILTGTDLYQQYAAGRVPIDPAHFGCQSEHRLRTKTEAMPVGPNDVLLNRVPGGGGIGDPLNREPDRVAADVTNGAVSPAAATNIYGVVLTDTGDVDHTATTTLRAQLTADRGSWTPATDLWPNTPTSTPTAATGQPAFRIHPRIESVDHDTDRVLKCTCGHVLTPANGNYKLGLLIDQSPVTTLPLVADPTVFLDEPMEFRRYACPGCHTLLTSEIARTTEPPLPDITLA